MHTLAVVDETLSARWCRRAFMELANIFTEKESTV